MALRAHPATTPCAPTLPPMALRARPYARRRNLKLAEVLQSWGDVDHKKFRQHVRALGVVADDAAIDEVFDDIDDDGGGSLDAAELKAGMKQLIDASKTEEAAKVRLGKQTVALRRNVHHQLSRIASRERQRMERMRQQAEEEAKKAAERQKAEADAEAAAKAAAKAAAVAAVAAAKGDDDAKASSRRADDKTTTAAQGAKRGGGAAGGGDAPKPAEQRGHPSPQRRGGGSSGVVAVTAKASAGAGGEGSTQQHPAANAAVPVASSSSSIGIPPGHTAKTWDVASGKPRVAGGEGAQTLEDWKSSLKRMLRQGRRWRPPGVHSTC
jgi:hypothetical protein